MTDEQIIAFVNERMERTETNLLERIEKTETNLLKEFRKYAIRIEARGRVTDALQIGYNERLTVLEQRVDDIEASK